MQAKTVIPNFLVVGATKAATTWLYKCLDAHPEIFVPLLKEVNYFSSRYDRGERWYLSHFKNVLDEKAVGELSPSYFINDRTPERIYRFNPDIRSIFMLRNPIERAYSHYCMELRYKTVSENIDRECGLESFIVREGLYYQHISKFIKLFPRENLKFIIYDDIKTEPEKVLADIFYFLGVNPKIETTELFKQRYVKQPRQKFGKLYTFLVAIYRWINNNNKLGQKILNYLKDWGINDKFHQLNSVKQGYPEFSPSKKQELINFYREDIQQLSSLIDRDMSHWLSM